MSANKPKPTIAIVATGGTIASTAPSENQLSDYKVNSHGSDLVAAVPALTELADYEFTQICNVESHQINDEVLYPLATTIQTLCDRQDVAAVVVTHGTDTLEETAYFLHLIVDTQKPIVLVGAMRPASALSADGPLNLYHAVVVACHPDSVGKGVLVVMNDRIASARHVTKGHANGVEAFVATEFGYLGIVAGQWVKFQNQIVCPHTAESEFKRIDLSSPLPAVDVIYDHQGAGSHHFDASVRSGARGIVLAATGQGSLSPQASAGVRLAQASGVTVVRSSRVWQGAIRHSVKDDTYGTVPAYTLNPPKARVLLRLTLSLGLCREDIEACFTRY